MPFVLHRGKRYETDQVGYLNDPVNWDPDFAEGAALAMGTEGGLSDEQWKVIRFVRQWFELTGRCPVIYKTCKGCQLSLAGLRALFPRGYQRGVCLLAGVSYRESVSPSWTDEPAGGARSGVDDKVYRVDAHGFLIDPSDWDQAFAQRLAEDLKMPAGLTDAHLKVIRYLRERQTATGVIPSVFETCEAHGLELDGLEALFPDGYHRGAIRLAGLRLR